MITLVGLLGNFVALALFLMQDTAFREVLPFWQYVFAAFCCFAYQTLDAVDGK